MIKPNQIILCNLHLRTTKKIGSKIKTLILKEVVFAYGENKNPELLKN